MSDEALSSLLLGLFLAGPVAFVLGMLFERTRNGVRSYKTAKASVPPARKLMWALIRAFSTRAGLVGLALVVALIGGIASRA